ncbi:hypothetical protein [Parasedimentitalea maritima]|uniref:Uncharacterized protein n=1 Tax=Parasedimentitalea maritima TaxID=2578117 RepID=A0A6A4RGQ8_9RHOB|nr:hypothetical protein [Zongyanglinia marina]KAE9632643.1 hypothetical protein GP644_02395 [Zongyanglinia marina]
MNSSGQARPSGAERNLWVCTMPNELMLAKVAIGGIAYALSEEMKSIGVKQ